MSSIRKDEADSTKVRTTQIDDCRSRIFQLDEFEFITINCARGQWMIIDFCNPQAGKVLGWVIAGLYNWTPGAAIFDARANCRAAVDHYGRVITHGAHGNAA